MCRRVKTARALRRVVGEELKRSAAHCVGSAAWVAKRERRISVAERAMSAFGEAERVESVLGSRVDSKLEGGEGVSDEGKWIVFKSTVSMSAAEIAFVAAKRKMPGLVRWGLKWSLKGSGSPRPSQSQRSSVASDISDLEDVLCTHVESWLDNR